MMVSVQIAVQSVCLAFFLLFTTDDHLSIKKTLMEFRSERGRFWTWMAVASSYGQNGNI